MPAVRTYEPPDALAAMVRLPSAELASNGLGLIFPNSATATILALAIIVRRTPQR